MVARRIADISVEDVERRTKPDKHYVYMLYVSWSDGTVSIIYRRYSQFYRLQTRLLDKFPIEAGAISPSDRIIPFLPGKKLFGRVQKVALERLQPLDEYCKILTTLPSHIGECKEVLEFYRATDEDIAQCTHDEMSDNDKSGISGPIQTERHLVIADYNKEGDRELNLHAGEHVHVFDKTHTGWWLVSAEDGEGWVPSAYLEPLDIDQDEQTIFFKPGQEEKYIVQHSHSPEFDDELEVEQGRVVEVIEKTLDGWWLVRYGNKEGRIPATCIQKANPSKARMALEKKVQTKESSKSSKKKEKYKYTEVVKTKGKKGKKNPVMEDSECLYVNVDEKLREEAEQEMADEEAMWASMVDDDVTIRHNPPPRKRSIKIKPLPLKVARQPPQRQDYFAIADFQPKGRNGLALEKGARVEVLERSTTGWWYVNGSDNREGWVPSSYLHVNEPPKNGCTQSQESNGDHKDSDNEDYMNVPVKPIVAPRGKVNNAKGPSTQDHQKTTKGPPTPPKPSQQPQEHPREMTIDEIKEEAQRTGRPIYMARSNFAGGEENETDLKQGELVIVLDKLGNGFWHVHSHAGVGWVPSHFLRHPGDLYDISTNTTDSVGRPSLVPKAPEVQNKAPLILPGPHTNRPRKKREVIKADTGFKTRAPSSDSTDNNDVTKSVSELRKRFANV